MNDPFDIYSDDEIDSAALRYVDSKIPSYIFESKKCLERIPSFRDECQKLESKSFKKKVLNWIDWREERAKEQIKNDSKWDRVSEILKAVK